MKNTKKIDFLIKILIILFFSVLFTMSYFEEKNILKGFIDIITSQGVLITDFLVIGGLGATFLNAFLILFFNLSIFKIFKIPIKGLALASFFTVFGFSFFGKNIFNILPIYIGGILYSKYANVEFKELILTLSFTTALAPFISELAFSVGSSQSSYLSAIILGVMIGFIITPLAQKMAGFHEGFNLYNLGFTGGILGAVMTSVMKAYKFEVTARRVISTEHNLQLLILCSLVFFSLFIIGFILNDNSLKNYKTLMKDPGLKCDFVDKYGYGLTFINMSFLGILSVAFVYILKQELNGPLLAGVLTVVGFAAHGKTPFNIIPILIGVMLASIGTTKDSFIIVLSGLFGTSLAPISGVYGMFWGIAAGWLHFSVVQSIGILHGGLNLYNNGFSAGIVAGFMLPIMSTAAANKDLKKTKYLERKKALYDSMKKFRIYLKED
ncbi:MAG: DUF1576 domain-containing protein [Fusobacteriaceae bacterium]